MPAFKDLTGQKRHYLTIKKNIGKKGNSYLWQCQCDCGTLVQYTSGQLSRVKTCGCKITITTHGQTDTPEYYAWVSMRQRCGYLKKGSGRKNYEGRGITVCDRWVNSFENFLADMGKRPSQKHSIDRIDNNGNYCPENCQWRTKKRQSNNRQDTLYYEYQGQTKALADWCRELGLNRHTIWGRLARGLSFKEAVELNHSHRES